MSKHDLDRALLLARQLADTLTEMAPMAQEVSLNGILKANIKLALWAVAEEQRDILSRIVQGLNAVQPKVLENALKRMEFTTERVFYEVSDRVVAYDWVDDHLRELIPILRSHLRPQEPARPLRQRRNGEPKPAPPVTEASTATPRS